MKFNKFIFKVALSVLLTFSFGASVNAATLFISSNQSSVSVGSTVNLTVFVNSEGVAINNAEATIKYPNELFDVVSVSKGSIFTLWVEEPAFSNASGVLTFNGGLPTPGFTGASGNILNITLRAKKTGSGEVFLSDGAVRANDGLGTDVLTSRIGSTISVVEAPVPVEVKTVEVSPEPAQPLQTLKISSVSHPNQDAWYKNSSPVFSWDVPLGATSIQTGISQNENDLPKTTYSPVISQKTVEGLDDGIWYFKVRVKKAGVWSAVSSYAVKIDTLVPVRKNADFKYDPDLKMLQISADFEDMLSGLDHYEILINNIVVKTITPEDFVSGVYSLPWTKAGSNNVKLIAYDKAGNTVDAVGSIILTPSTESKTVENKSIPISFTVTILLLLILVSIAYLRNTFLARFVHRQKIRRAIYNADTPKIILLLRSRLEKHLEMLHKIRHSRILTKEEKEIKEALEEDLDEIDKSMEDLR